jgi:hypothetical protein
VFSLGAVIRGREWDVRDYAAGKAVRESRTGKEGPEGLNL